MSKWVEKIESKLDKLQATPGKFGLKGLKRDETCSYPDTEIIGRDDDVKELVRKLLHSDISVHTIVGMGGMGKTALVQRVFNHEKIKTEDISKWRDVQKFELANLDEGENTITPILKLSYHNLKPPLKSCFSYCSLYPKDYEIYKKELIRLWIAQGYVVSRGNGQSVEDAVEEYFLVLLQRCFFQDVEKYESGEIYSFKLHDLMHDVALEVSNKEICPTISFTRDMDKVVRHVSLTSEQYANFNLINAHVRTILRIGSLRSAFDSRVRPFLEKCRRLRTLNLSHLDIGHLPASIGKLIHLRHLDLSYNLLIEVLPNSITKLYNLQTLDLNLCCFLKELPKSFNDLVNLRVLRLDRCIHLTLMPCIITGMSKLISLDLSTFNVGAMHSHSSLKQQLEAFKALKMVRGRFIQIVIHLPSSDVLATEGGYIRDKDNFDSICFKFVHQESSEGWSYYEEESSEGWSDYEEESSEGGSDDEEELSGGSDDEEESSEGGRDYEEELSGGSDDEEESSEGGSDYEDELLGALRPHGNLKQLELFGYRGVRLPRSWAIEDNLGSVLPNLVLLELSECWELKCLPLLGNLQNVKELSLKKLPKLKYVETPLEIVSKHGEASGELLQFFPCLQKLTLHYLPQFKGWGRSGEIGGVPDSHQSSLVFSKLINLDISSCRNLTSLPGCPNVKTLSLRRFNERLRITSNPTIHGDHSLSWLDSSVPIESLNKFMIGCDEAVENLVAYGRVFQACSSSLQTLTIYNCQKLRSVSGGLVYLNALESLTLVRLPKLNLANEDEDIERDVECDDMPWGALSHTLSYLRLFCCPEVQTFPKWMRKLTSLQQLTVYGSSKELYERCQNPNGEDWPNIQHIPSIEFEDYPKSNQSQ